MTGKGDDRRPLSVDETTFSDNWHRIFGKGADPAERQKVGEAIADRAFAAQDAKREYYASVRSKNYADSLRLEGIRPKTRFTEFRVEDYLDSPEAIASYEAELAKDDLLGTSSTVEPLALNEIDVGSNPTSPAMYIDDSSGQQVDENWWPGDQLPPNPA